MFDLFSWGTFIGLNWPADEQGNPLPGKIGSAPDAPRVWETYLQPSQIFRPNGAEPLPWGTPEGPTRSLGSISKHTHILDEVDEAFFNLETPMPPITDLNKEYVRYEIRINKEEYDYINNNVLYSVEGQNDFIKAGKTVSFPSGKAGATPVRGAMELKAAWKKMGPGDDPKKFHTIEATVEQPFAPEGTPSTKGLYGLDSLASTSWSAPKAPPSGSGPPSNTSPTPRTSTSAKAFPPKSKAPENSASGIKMANAPSADSIPPFTKT